MTTTDRLAAFYVTVVTDRLGLEAEFNGEVVVVRSKGRPYLIDLDADDPEYLRISTGGRHGLDLDAATLASLAAVTTDRTKGAKVAVRGEVVMSAVELVVGLPDCLPAPDMVAAVLPRALSMIDAGVMRFLQDGELAGIAAASAGVGTPVGEDVV